MVNSNQLDTGCENIDGSLPSVYVDFTVYIIAMLKGK